jgi:histidinol-phosphate phosphatase family protein
MNVDIVIPTVGRPSVQALLDRLDRLEGPRPRRIIVVEDDGGNGPAAARNSGWRSSQAEWVVFLDDDVLPEPDWLVRLAADLSVPEHVAGSQGRIRVPLPADRRPTDWERNVQGLETARYATADMAYRHSVLEEVRGFDERFPRAYREDADLALRVLRLGYRIETGEREVVHPVRPVGFWASVARQSGNADDVLMRSLHGPFWQERAVARRGNRREHLATTTAGAVGLAAVALGRRKVTAVAALAWATGVTRLAWRRIAPGPRTRAEVLQMAVTSAVLPAAATFHWLVGWARLPRLLARSDGRPAAVLFDRDGTLVEDVPYNGDPARVVAVEGAREALDRLRASGVPLAVISNQSGVGRGLITEEQVAAVNRRVEELLGPIDEWLHCPHEPGEGCECRKPRPGLVRRAASALGVPQDRCAVVGDIGSDVEAARAAGARGVLVPTPRTRRDEIDAAPEVAKDLGEAVDRLLGGVR